ncbi:uncharacterized protein [Hyperolius riggenbachi]|uniref:uncharacterized protein n=1 Tax=Hyperolius riggenbachi TaxID=752182 RepID=UPI0035A36A95
MVKICPGACLVLSDMSLSEKMNAYFRLTFLAAVLIAEICAQPSTASDFILSSCRKSQIQLDLPAEHVLGKQVRFSAIDQDGGVALITDGLATQCGYKISQDDWGNVVFRGSLYSCYVQIQNDTYFTVQVKIEISSRPDMVGAEVYIKTVSCPYYWKPREIFCETNYMEVSVRRKIPLIAEGIFRDEPEDWAAAFDEAVVGLMSIWQVVFHKSSTQKISMLIDAAQERGYGVNTTDARTLLRSSYNATEAVFQKVDAVTFSTLRATLFYKQRWFIFLIDNAVACPVDDVKFSPGWITWTIPKNISPLLVGAKVLQKSSSQFGLDLLDLTNADILSGNYDVVDGAQATTVRIPMGADGGYYKSHVVNQEHGVTYSINPFLENNWVDDGWGVTKYTIVKDITTPFEKRPPIITNDTVSSTLIFSVTIGNFLPDVYLVNVTIGGTTFPVPEAIKTGYNVTSRIHPNGTSEFVLKVPFTDPRVSFKSLTDGLLFTLNVTFGFNIIPHDETFISSTVVQCFVPKPTAYCEQENGMLSATIGNLDPAWNVYIKDVPATTSNGMLASGNATYSKVQIPAQSDLVAHEAVGGSVAATIPINIKDGSGSTIYSIVAICDVPPIPVVCQPNGTIQVTVKKVADIRDMDLSQLVLRDRSCKPNQVDSNNAYFTFFADSCQTLRTFQQGFIIYENQVTYSLSGRILFIMNVTCNYTTNGTVVIEDYKPYDNPTPSAQSIMASLDLVLRLSKDDSYTDFYENMDYPVVKYLRDPLYFEVELLYSSDSRLELFLDTCWATASPEMGSLPSWPIVVNSCEYGEPYQTIFHQVTADSRVQFPSHFKRFEVKTFSFMNGDQPYTGSMFFHCDVIICDASNLSSDPVCTGIGSCIPARQRLGRSVNSNEDNIRSISSGAVYLLAPRAESYMQY